MKPGSLVTFTSTVYKHWEVGMIISHNVITDREGRTYNDFYNVLTHEGVKVVSRCFMEIVK